MKLYFLFLAIVILVLEFIFIFSPAVIGLNTSNEELRELNKDLTIAVSDLQSSEEEIRSNMDQIHELKEELEKSELMYRGLVTEASDMIYELDQEGKFSYLNPITESVTGYSKAELLGKLYSDVLHEKDRERVMQFYRRQLETQEPVTYLEFRIRTKEGNVVWVGQNARMLFDEKWVYRVSVVSRDISEIKKVESQLKSERLLLRTIIDNIPVNIYVKDTLSRKILANRTEYEYVGAKQEEEILGKSDMDLYPSESAQVSMEEDARIISGESMLNVETVNTRKDGSRTWFLVSKVPLKDDNDNIVGLVGISIDITESKKAQEALKQAKENAEEATLAKSRFLSMMSHEIRTPLNGMIGLTNILSDSSPREDQIENLKLLKFSSENLLTIINDILDFNKIEAGKMELESIPFSLNEIIDQYQRMLQVRANEKGIELKTDIDPKVPKYVLGDPVRLGQVLNNLIGNAIKFTEHGSVEVKLEELQTENKLHRIRFSVKDTGIGIPADKVEFVFAGFTQASSDTTRKFGGTGLGLSITKKLLSLMGSEIKVNSVLSSGSTFSFELLMNESDALLQETQYEQQTHKILNILVVDDNQVNQIVSSKFLKKWGHSVSTASSGDEALELLDKTQFQIILLDLQMPEMDGYQVAKEIRSREEDYFKNVPIIALSADVLSEVKDKVIASGMNDYLSKPFQAFQLQQIINKYADKVDVVHSNGVLKSKIGQLTQGDESYTAELTKHILANLNELKDSIYISANSNDVTVFDKAHHKSKTTLFILEDERMDNLLSAMKSLFASGQFNLGEDLKKRIETVFGEVLQEIT
ncbi:MAG: PAS domain S-box protein [Cyclobacteriaceae bacterium]